MTFSAGLIQEVLARLITSSQEIPCKSAPAISTGDRPARWHRAYISRNYVGTSLEILKERISLCWEFIPLILFTSDAWEQYFIGLKKIFGFRHRPRRRARVGRRRNFEYYLPWNILYATVSKIKNGAGRMIRISRNIVHGYTSLVDRVIQKSSVSSTINTSFIERANGTFRSFCSRLVRKTYSFSRLASYHDAHVAIIAASYNFVHPHRTLTRLYNQQTTPAMASGLTNHCWSIRELCSFPVFRDHC